MTEKKDESMPHETGLHEAGLHETVLGGGPRHVVFLHGLFGQGKNFSTAAKALAEHDADLTVHLVDLPNHGRSAWTKDFSYLATADAIAGWLNERIGEPVALLGHSMGGKVAMVVALQHPELVERLVVADISPGTSTGVSGFATYVEAMRAIDLAALTSRKQADEELVAAVPSATTRGFLLQNLRRVPAEAGGTDQGATWQWQMNLELLGNELRQIGGWPDQHFEPYPGPTLWLAGEHSDYITDDDRPLMAQLFPQYRKVTIKRSGHWVHAEQPEAFTSVVAQFLGVSPSSPT